jgi:hypothetical protein
MRYYIVLIIVLIALLFGCMKPYQEDIYVDIKPNETAFVLPLEGANKENQKQFASIDFLNEKKVAAKRIQIPTRWHQTARQDHVGRWIPTMMIIKVDRTPITREWTADAGTGTTDKNQAIKAESKESIEFSIGVTFTASILEKDASAFLYFYSGKSLAEIIDLNCRSYVQGRLTAEFAQYDLAEGRARKKEIFDRLYQSAKSKFAEKGITIDYVGAAGGLVYTDPSIQEAINKKFSAEMDRSAETDRRIAAQEFAKASEARKKQIDIEIMRMNAEANLERAKRWDGKLPANILPSSMASNFLMNMDGKK